MGWHGALHSLFVTAKCNIKRQKEIAREQWGLIVAKAHN
jgi:hypothetical protein